MEDSSPPPQGDKRNDHDQPGYYLPAMPSEALVGVVQRLVAELDRYDLD